MVLGTLLLGAMLLPMGVGLATHERSQGTSRLDHSLTAVARFEAKSIQAYFERARSIVLLSAQNESFTGFYEAPGTRAEKIASGGPVVLRTNHALDYLQSLYPRSIGESCFIDVSGAENSRVVRGVYAAPDELSPDESVNPFFGPTFALQAGQAYQAAPYESPDTGEWVISNSAVLPGDEKRAIVHFEVTVESFRRTLAARYPDAVVQVVEASTGDVIIDSRFPQEMGTPLGRPGDLRFNGAVDEWSDSGLTTLSGTRMAFQRLQGSKGNANDWYLVAGAPAAEGWLAGVSIPATVIVVLGLILLILGAFGLRVSLRTQREKMANLARDLEHRKQAQDLLQGALERERDAAAGLRTLNQMKNAFLQAVSHELRTPLTSVIGYAHTLKDAELGGLGLSPAEREEMMDRLVVTSEKLKTLLTDLLDLDRMDRGILTPRLEPADVGTVVRRVIDDMDTEDRVVTVDAGSTMGLLDVPKFERIVENLVANALKHTSPDVAVAVRVREEKLGVLVVVEDEGPGIPDGLKESIFEPFRQGDSASGHSQGTGIGLALVTRFAELQGGRAWVEDGPQGGSSFRVLLRRPPAPHVGGDRDADHPFNRLDEQQAGAQVSSTS